MPSRSRSSCASSESRPPFSTRRSARITGSWRTAAISIWGCAGWIADYKDPETFLGIGRRASGNNFSHYDSAEFERLMDSAAAAGGRAGAAHAAPAEAEKVMIDDLAFIPLLFFSFHNIVSSASKAGRRTRWMSIPRASSAWRNRRSFGRGRRGGHLLRDGERQLDRGRSLRRDVGKAPEDKFASVHLGDA